MILFPAIDIRHGKCVRLLQGDPTAETVYADDPAEVAASFEEAGAEWLHMVNLDGAFGDEENAETADALQAIIDRVEIPVQLGGGIRNITDIQKALDMGVTRVILGTMAVERIRQMPDILARFGAKQIVIGVDTRGDKVATHGWQKTSNLDAIDFGKEMRSMGVTRIIHTDISRDGALSGINLHASLALADATGLRVIVSGGVAGLNDVRWANAAGGKIDGLIVGRALYDGTFTLPEALMVLNE